MERVNIFVDGANFYYLAIKKLGIAEDAFDFQSFTQFLAGSRTLGAKRYYIGTLREKPSNRALFAAQVRHLALLRNGDWETKTSKLRTRTEEIRIDSRVENYKKILDAGIRSIKIERLHEKGIDVKLATDLIMGAVDNKYDTAIVVSSDADLVTAIDWVRGRFKKKVEYVGFSIPDEKNPENSIKPLFSMISKTDIQLTLTAEDLNRFIVSNPQG